MLTEKDIIEKGKFLIADQEAGALAVKILLEVDRPAG